MKDTSSSDRTVPSASEPWIAIPADDISISLPMSMFDYSVKIKFVDVDAIDNVIEQLQTLKEVMGGSVSK